MEIDKTKIWEKVLEILKWVGSIIAALFVYKSISNTKKKQSVVKSVKTSKSKVAASDKPKKKAKSNSFTSKDFEDELKKL